MRINPLGSIEGFDGVKVGVERTPIGWHFTTPTGFKAKVRGFKDGIICRVAPGVDKEVVQLGIGAATSLLCNALYSPSEDTALVFKADDLSIEAVKGRLTSGFTVSCTGPMDITVMESYMKVHRDLPWFKPLDKKHFPKPPAGWCSWYYYYLNINEEEVVKNTDWLEKNLKQFGCEWVQIDDGWQGRGKGLGTNRDWFITHEPDFPHGMKYSADHIRSKGFRPGIWLIPFGQSNEELFKNQPSLFVRKEDGGSPGKRETPWNWEGFDEADLWVDWVGHFFIDPTGKDGREYLQRLFKMVCDEWGYEYVKIDGQSDMAPIYTKNRRQLADPSLDGVRAYHAGLDAIKSVMGKDRFLLSCGHCFDSPDYCQGVRTSGDVYLEWTGIEPAIVGTMRWLFINTIMYYTDPDVVCVREPLPYEQAELWANLYGITGQLLMASDKMYELPDERVDLLRRIFPVADIHPMELYPLDQQNKPSIFDLKIGKPSVGKWDVVALFNWSTEEAKAFDLTPEKLGLKSGEWVVMDFKSGKLVHKGNGKIQVHVPPTSCRVIGYWEDESRPQLVGTNRHITQGAVDLLSVKWDENKLRLSGMSEVVGGDPYHLRIYVPEGYKATTKGVTQDGQIAELVLNNRKNGKSNWRIDFTHA